MVITNYKNLFAHDFHVSDSVNMQADNSRINCNFGKNIHHILLFLNNTEASKNLNCGCIIR